MKKNLLQFCLTLPIGLGLLFSSGCETSYHGRADVYYDYEYYPTRNVYFYPERRVYYWNDSGRWHSGSRLPAHYEIHDEHSEHLHVRTRQPWTEHHSDHDDHDHDHH